jgi:cytochrome c553
MKSLLTLLVCLISFSASAEDRVTRGEAKAAICATCHGVDGIALMPAYPNLAGQNEEYLISSMKAYRDKQRQGGMAVIMQMQAAQLSDDDIADLAAYYANMK